jgi:translation elongation factor EF-4
VDFAWEVSRSLAACEGALLLVDSTQGVQAQTISVFHVAQERGLKIVPVLNKVIPDGIDLYEFLTLIPGQIDMPAAQPELIATQMQSTFGIKPEDILRISAKTGQGVESILKAIVERIPPPSGRTKAPLKALLFDSL